MKIRPDFVFAGFVLLTHGCASTPEGEGSAADRGEMNAEPADSQTSAGGVDPQGTSPAQTQPPSDTTGGNSGAVPQGGLDDPQASNGMSDDDLSTGMGMGMGIDEAAPDDDAEPAQGPVTVSDADCQVLISDPTVNWRDSALQTDQQIVTCLSTSLGRAVGYGANARGGYDPAGASKLTVIRKDASVSVEQQLADAVSGEEHNWVVFDKVDFAEPYDVALYRLHCDDASVQAALGVDSAALCLDHERWCESNGVASDRCLDTFFNERLNDGDLPIRNVRIGSNTTIDGRQSQARLLFSGFAIGSDSSGEPVETASSVIVTHMFFKGAGHTEDHGLDPDMIRSTGASHDIWIHQNTFELTGDSAFDVKVGAHALTMSFNLVKDVKRATLHGSSDSRTINEEITTTMHHNAFITSDALYETFGNTARRVPLIRRGKSHMFNNVFFNYRKEILSVRAGAEVVFEDNMFLVNSAVTDDSDSDLGYFAENLLRGYREGGLEVRRSRVFWADGACNLDASQSADLTASHGVTTDLAAQYTASSQSELEANRSELGPELVSYVLATAGKAGAAPFNSPYTKGRAALSSQPHLSCQR